MHSEFLWIPALLVTFIGVLIAVVNIINRSIGDARQESNRAAEAASSCNKTLSDVRSMYEKQCHENLILLKNIEEVFLQIESVFFLISQGSGGFGAQNAGIFAVIQKRTSDATQQVKALRYLHALEYGNSAEVYAAACYLNEHRSSMTDEALKKQLTRADLSAEVKMSISNIIENNNDI